MNRRELLKGMLALGLVMPSTKLIFDLGKNSYKNSIPFGPRVSGDMWWDGNHLYFFDGKETIIFL